MTTLSPDLYKPALFEVPVPPQEFGQDGGKFYRCYDSLVEEIDNDLVTSLKEQLDGLLIFAGLFAGVNTAFLALTLPLMSSDPADDTNALLRDNNAILLNLASGRNDSLPSTTTLPSETFSPTGKVLTVNVLFSVSLTFALVSSFLAVLGRQWLFYYRKRSRGGPDLQRWEQLKRFLGAERWRLEWILDAFLPSLLQIGLIIFCISLTIYLSTLHPMLSNIIGAFMCMGLAILIMTAISAYWDKFCPLQSPLSHFIPWVICLAVVLAFILVFLIIDLISLMFETLAAIRDYCLGTRTAEVAWESIEIMELTQMVVSDLLKSGFSFFVGRMAKFVGSRREEEDGTLHITAIRRAICASDDASTQAHAVSNILGITDADLLSRLATDADFDLRISELCGTMYARTLQLCGRGRPDVAAKTSWLYRAAITHVRLLTTNSRDGVEFGPNGPEYATPPLSIDQILHAPSNLVTAWLGYMTVSHNRYPSKARRAALGFIIDGLVDPSWRCISMLIEVIRVEWAIHDGSHEELHAAYRGNPSTALQNLKLVVKKSNDPGCRDRATLWKYLVKIINFASEAPAQSTEDRRLIQELDVVFLSFKAEVQSVFRGIKRRKRDPDLRWCYYDE